MTRAGVLAGIAAVLLLVATPVAWSRTADATRQPAADPVAGKVLFRTKGCSACHTGPDSVGQESFPNLSDAPVWAGRRRPGLTAAAYIKQSIFIPTAFISPVWGGSGGTPGMPQLTMTEREADAIAAYLLHR